MRNIILFSRRRTDVALKIINSFKARVSTDGGTFEAGACLKDILIKLSRIS